MGKSKGMMKCPVCSVSLKTINLSSHLNRMHPKEAKKSDIRKMAKNVEKSAISGSRGGRESRVPAYKTIALVVIVVLVTGLVAALAMDNSTNDEENSNGSVGTITLVSPKGGETLKGVHDIRWSAISGDGGPLSISIKYTTDPKKFCATCPPPRWTTLSGNEANNGHFGWDTTDFKNGNNYMLKITASDGTDSIVTVSNTFSIVNGANNIPTISLLSPTDGESLSGTVTIGWSASDVDSDPLTITIQYSTGGNWFDIAVDEVNDGSFDWDSSSYGNGDYMLKVIVSDGSDTNEDYVGNISLSN